MGGKAKRDYHAKACKRGRANISARSGHGEPDKVLTCQPPSQGPAAFSRPKITVYITRMYVRFYASIYTTSVCGGVLTVARLGLTAFGGAAAGPGRCGGGGGGPAAPLRAAPSPGGAGTAGPIRLPPPRPRRVTQMVHYKQRAGPAPRGWQVGIPAASPPYPPARGGGRGRPPPTAGARRPPQPTHPSSSPGTGGKGPRSREEDDGGGGWWRRRRRMEEEEEAPPAEFRQGQARGQTRQPPASRRGPFPAANGRAWRAPRARRPRRLPARRRRWLTLAAMLCPARPPPSRPFPSSPPLPSDRGRQLPRLRTSPPAPAVTALPGTDGAFGAASPLAAPRTARPGPARPRGGLRGSALRQARRREMRPRAAAGRGPFGAGTASVLPGVRFYLRFSPRFTADGLASLPVASEGRRAPEGPAAPPGTTPPMSGGVSSGKCRQRVRTTPGPAAEGCQTPWRLPWWCRASRETLRSCFHPRGSDCCLRDVFIPQLYPKASFRDAPRMSRAFNRILFNAILAP